MKLEKLKGRGSEYLYRHPKYKTLYYRRFTRETGEVMRSLRTADLNIAKQKRDDILRGSQTTVRQRKTALELFDKWVERKRTLKKSAATITSLLDSRRHFEPFLSTMMPEEITAAWWESEYVPTARQMFGDKRKFFNDCKWLKGFLKQIYEDGILHKRPILINPDQKRSIGKVLSDEDVGTLLNFAQNEDLHLAILMAATMGMRRGEIFGLRSQDINPRDWSIKLVAERTKTRKEREFTISPAVLPFLKERLKSGSPWIFPSKLDLAKPLHKDGYMTAWRNLKKMTGISGRFHDLRHTFLTKAFSAPGANPALICNYAGLSLEVAERVYLHLTKEDSKRIAGLVTYDV
jgi:integrase